MNMLHNTAKHNTAMLSVDPLAKSIDEVYSGIQISWFIGDLGDFLQSFNNLSFFLFCFSQVNWLLDHKLTWNSRKFSSQLCRYASNVLAWIALISFLFILFGMFVISEFFVTLVWTSEKKFFVQLHGFADFWLQLQVDE